MSKHDPLDPKQVHDVKTLVAFIRALSKDAAKDEALFAKHIAEHPSDKMPFFGGSWEHGTISEYLEGMAACIEDNSKIIQKEGATFKDDETLYHLDLSRYNVWAAVACALWAGKIYE